MNLRILKKLSKRAAPLLALLGDHREQFKADKGGCYTAQTGHDRKHWERNHAKYPLDMRGDIKYMPTKGDLWIVLREPSSPLEGTVMVGAMAGYYEPEWEEQTAWEALLEIVWDNFTDYSDIAGWRLTRSLDTPTKVLRAARDIIKENNNA